ncbi:hypothetical protein SAMN05216302_10463 [Nitrosomonas aestuarii]|uniref:Uncharacterized protein n=1 Tax=Nitrosomonas aestuarii TaxID=52441 RepID=A0A1I4G2H6_9PROT|nr:hypothetical protein SAMN05216302_10463 [Nitrosomonas aestuarii]
MSMAVSLSLYSHTSLRDAMDLQPSVVKCFFDSKPFDEWKKGKSNEIKTQGEIINRLNSVISAIGAIARKRI